MTTRTCLSTIAWALLVTACSAAGSQDPAPEEAEGATTDALTDEGGATLFAVAHDPWAAGRYVVSRANRARTRCADGVRRTYCRGVALDLDASGVAQGEIEPSIHGLFEGTQILVDGVVERRADGAVLRAARVYRAPSPLELDAPIYRVALAADCRASSPCTRGTATPDGAARGRAVRAVDFADAPKANACGDAPAATDEASTAVAEADLRQGIPLVATGTIDRRGALRARGYFIWQPGPCRHGIRGRGL